MSRCLVISALIGDPINAASIYLAWGNIPPSRHPNAAGYRDRFTNVGNLGSEFRLPREITIQQVKIDDQDIL